MPSPASRSGVSEADYTRTKNAALRLLTYRSRSEQELRSRLQRRFPQEAIDRAVASLLRQGLLDDAAFARQWREQREKFRPRGPAVIKRELQKLGVDSEVIQEALSDFDAAGNAYQAGSKYAAKLSLEDGTVFRRKLGGFLSRRGFQGDVLGQTVERLWRELSEPLDG
ncbi:MAG TPA: hypothetical protein DHW65_08820 [Dehalococcoidia bacterium]|nr:hypothetical protein [Chloroflexota bacterium]MQF94449.1 regulatory protein RecX [SAR202 cluster bacterium]HAA95503.1 hypothetical protein [Dehalococcoidia bacterium]HCL26429.1 hypothetical protein [Dehalococcoidia bacterium]|tara:strand:+ start:379 stop:882 length:504 start_codon:yes stop_codon:yes gene_type:complete